MRRVMAAIVATTLVALTSGTAWAQANWTVGTEMPSPRSEIGAGAIDGQVYVLGGGVGASLTVNEVLDVASGQWRTGTPMPRGLNHHGVTTLNGKVYVFGGADESGRPTATALEYDPTSNSWRSLADLPTPRSSPGVAALDGFKAVYARRDAAFWVAMEGVGLVRAARAAA